MSLLLHPIRYGGIECANRIVMAPLTRLRACVNTNVLPEYAWNYYVQRASAGLIISEATNISPVAIGYAGSPGIWSPEQVEQWKKITTSVHAAGGKIVCQLWHTGIVGHESLHPGVPVMGPSAGDWNTRATYPDEKGVITRGPSSPCKAMTIEDIERTIKDYGHATANAKAAGFDGVELHGAHGYLIHAFLSKVVNKRNDEYGSNTFENRVRFLDRVIDECERAWRADCENPAEKSHIGLRLSPFGTFNRVSLGDDAYEFTKQLFAYLNTKKLAYIHVSEPGWDGVKQDPVILTEEYYKELHALLSDTAHIGSGGYTKELAEERVGSCVDAVAFGRPFIANPDLVDRFAHNWPLAPYDPSVAYVGGPKGYVDYPCFVESL